MRVNELFIFLKRHVFPQIFTFSGVPPTRKRLVPEEPQLSSLTLKGLGPEGLALCVIESSVWFWVKLKPCFFLKFMCCWG